QICGAIVKGKGKNCSACGAFVSPQCSTALPVTTQSTQPLSVSVKPDPLVVEKVVAHRHLTTCVQVKDESSQTVLRDALLGGPGGGGGVEPAWSGPGRIFASNPWSAPEPDAASQESPGNGGNGGNGGYSGNGGNGECSPHLQAPAEPGARLVPPAD